MKIRNYVILVLTIVIIISAGTEVDNISLVEGSRAGDIAPVIKIPNIAKGITFRNDTGCYTLLHFWAAYDAQSRFYNVWLHNKLASGEYSGIRMISISMDESDAVFEETVKTDNLAYSIQLHDKRGINSEVYKKYALKRGLRNFLIDDKGVIVAVNVTPDKLRKIVRI